MHASSQPGPQLLCNHVDVAVRGFSRRTEDHLHGRWLSSSAHVSQLCSGVCPHHHLPTAGGTRPTQTNTAPTEAAGSPPYRSRRRSTPPPPPGQPAAAASGLPSGAARRCAWTMSGCLRPLPPESSRESLMHPAKALQVALFPRTVLLGIGGGRRRRSVMDMFMEHVLTVQSFIFGFGSHGTHTHTTCTHFTLHCGSHGLEGPPRRGECQCHGSAAASASAFSLAFLRATISLGSQDGTVLPYWS